MLSNGNSVPSAGNLIPNFNGLRVTEVFRDGTNLVIRWRGGAGPCQVQRQAGLNADDWQNIGTPTMLKTVSVPITGATGFFASFSPDS